MTHANKIIKKKIRHALPYWRSEVRSRCSDPAIAMQDVGRLQTIRTCDLKEDNDCGVIHQQRYECSRGRSGRRWLIWRGLIMGKMTELWGFSPLTEKRHRMRYQLQHRARDTEQITKTIMQSHIRLTILPESTSFCPMAPIPPKCADDMIINMDIHWMDPSGTVWSWSKRKANPWHHCGETITWFRCAKHS